MTDWIGWIGAIGSPAALAGLGTAVYELRAGRADRRDDEASQARLITIEFQKTDNPLFFRFGVFNRSQAPVFDLTLVRVGYIESRSDSAIIYRHPEASLIGNTGLRAGMMILATVDTVPVERVLGAEGGTWMGYEWHDPDWREIAPDPKAELAKLDYGVTVRFLDTHGRRWERTNTVHPERVLPSRRRTWSRRGMNRLRTAIKINF